MAELMLDILSSTNLDRFCVLLESFKAYAFLEDEPVLDHVRDKLCHEGLYYPVLNNPKNALRKWKNTNMHCCKQAGMNQDPGIL